MASPLTSSFSTTDPAQVQAYYDKWADSYDADVSAHHYNGPKYLLEQVLKFVPDRNARILLVGAGTGLDGVMLYEAGYRNMDAHDGSCKMLKEAIGRGIFQRCYFEMLQADKQSCFPTGFYDVVLCVGCFLPGALDARHLQDLFRPLKPNGLMIIGSREMFCTPNPKGYDYPYDLVGEYKKMVKSGQVKELSVQRYENYSEKLPGLFFVHKKL